MDLRTAAATTAIRYLLLHTPQGWTYLFFSVLTFIAGAFAVVYPSVGAWGPFRAGSFLLIYPILLFCALLWFSSSDDFEPSRTTAFFVAAFGALPFFFPYIHDAVA